MAFAALFSGGKDSTYSVYLAQGLGFDVKYLVTMLSENPDSYMFHTPNADLTNLHAEAMNLKLVSGCTTGKQGSELTDLKKVLDGLPISGLIAGTVASSYQMQRIEEICAEQGLELFAPLWHRREDDILGSIVRDGFECIFVAICAEGFDESWLGRRLDRKAIDDLTNLRDTYGINLSGEGGEYETLILDGPNFRKRIFIETVEKTWMRDSGKLLVIKASLADKSQEN